MKRRTFIVEKPQPLSAAVAAALGVPEARAGALVSGGAVYVQGRRAVELHRPVRAQEKVTVVLEESGADAGEARPLPALEILFEDEALLAVNKPAGVVTQPTPARVGDSLLDAVSAHLGRPAGLVHRLDRDTSGVVVFAKSKEATSRLAAAFREGRAQKTYLAITRGGLPERGHVTLRLAKDPSRPGRWQARAGGNGLDAITDFERLADGAVSLVKLWPRTGRTHQLRAHLAGLGHPIVGDRLYGGPAGPRCLLHAWTLELDGQRFEAELPADMRPSFEGVELR